VFWRIWHVAVWKWLLEKHLIARQAFFATEYRPRPKEPAIDSPQPSWADFHASCHSGENCRYCTGEINLCTLFSIKHCRHRPPRAFDAATDFFKLKQKSKASRICFFFSKNLDIIKKEKMYVVV